MSQGADRRTLWVIVHTLSSTTLPVTMPSISWYNEHLVSCPEHQTWRFCSSSILDSSSFCDYVVMLWCTQTTRWFSFLTDTHIHAIGKFWQLLLEHNESSSKLSQRNSGIDLKVLILNQWLMEIAIWQHQKLHITPEPDSLSRNLLLYHWLSCLYGTFQMIW